LVGHAARAAGGAVLDLGRKQMVPVLLLHLRPWTPSPPGTDSSASRSPTAQLPTGTLTATPWPGVFDLRWGGRTIRLILLGEIAAHPRNAPWEVFSARLERVRRGLRNYHPRNPSAKWGRTTNSAASSSSVSMPGSKGLSAPLLPTPAPGGPAACRRHAPGGAARPGPGVLLRGEV